MEEEIYDEAEADNKPMVIGNKPKPAAPPNKPSPSVNGGTTATMTLKERMALLQAKTNGTADPLLGQKKPPPGGVKSIVDLSNNNSSKPPTANKPKFPPPTTNKPPVINMSDIKTRKHSLKAVLDKRASQISDGGSIPEQEDQKDGKDIVETKDGKRFKRLPFAKKPLKPNKPAALKDVSLPIVKYLDVTSGVEQRIGGGRGQRESEDMIPSMTEEEELDEGPSPPAIPAVPHPTIPSNMKKPLPPPPGQIEEEVYDDAEADVSVDQDGQELYEDFDEVLAGVAELKSPTPTPARADTPQPSPDPTRKISKAEKEKERKEKLKQEKLAKEREKQRQKEIKERETVMKKFKLSEEDVVTSHFVKARKAASGGKMMLAVEANEAFQLVRKTDCPNGKWIVRNPKSDTVGLVDASNMIDLDAPPLPSDRRPVPKPDDEEIYEEI